MCYVLYLLNKGIKYKQKKKKWGKDDEGIAWTKCVLDPDGPIRPTEEDAKKYLYRKMRKNDIPNSQRED